MLYYVQYYTFLNSIGQIEENLIHGLEKSFRFIAIQREIQFHILTAFVEKHSNDFLKLILG